jgi:hypothetical protein
MGVTHSAQAALFPFMRGRGLDGRVCSRLPVLRADGDVTGLQIPGGRGGRAWFSICTSGAAAWGVVCALRARCYNNIPALAKTCRILARGGRGRLPPATQSSIDARMGGWHGEGGTQRGVGRRGRGRARARRRKGVGRGSKRMRGACGMGRAWATRGIKREARCQTETEGRRMTDKGRRLLWDLGFSDGSAP